ncbi:MAG: S8 family serine peptidase [Acidobacteriia bacterium]|nr:S8 family serine peptidase [Terriglobia bacterium]
MPKRIAKVFARGAEQQEIGRKYDVVEPYEAFVLVRGSNRQIEELSKKYPTQDITDAYHIETPFRRIDTNRPRLSAEGTLQKHPAYKKARRLSVGLHHYLVQFVGPIKQKWLKGIRTAGGELRAPQNDFTWIVRADSRKVTSIAALPYVRWVGHLPWEDRVSPAVLKNPGRQPGDTRSVLPRTRVLPGVYSVEFFGPEDLRAALPQVRKLGFKILDQDRRANMLVLESLKSAATRARQFRNLSAVHGVRFIRERVVKRSANNVATGIICNDAVRGPAGLGLSGDGEYVGICDTGLDTGILATINRDFANRVALIKSYPITPDFSSQITNPGANDGPADLDSGHGTHVSGSVLGNGTNSTSIAGLSAPVRGLAYKAKLVFQAVEQEMHWKPEYRAGNDRYELAGIPADLTNLFQYAYRNKARVHSNSWGGGEPGEYDSQCSQLDDFVWKHKDFCVVVAAGNDGTDKDGDGKINPMSVTSPGTAKNCITIGACENLRPEFDAQRYGDWWPDDYPVPPFRDDSMADDPSSIVPFSSRGPTRDGRVKPEVIGPGTFILSTRSSQIANSNKGWAAYPKSRLYFFMGGTSMATPLIAGAAALIREYYRKNRSVKNPTAALVKATLIAGADRIGSAAARKGICDSDQGFGRVNLGKALAPASPARLQFVEQGKGPRTGESQTIDIAVKSGKSPLRVVLAYTDYPGPALVNDLNLIVHSPSGKQYVGNQDGSSLNLDAKNNVEVVHIPKPSPGTWKIEIVGSNVPREPQDYALVYLGHV